MIEKADPDGSVSYGYNDRGKLAYAAFADGTSVSYAHNPSQSASVLRRYMISLPLGVSTALRMFSSLPLAALM